MKAKAIEIEVENLSRFYSSPLSFLLIWRFATISFNGQIISNTNRVRMCASATHLIRNVFDGNAVNHTVNIRSAHTLRSHTLNATIYIFKCHSLSLSILIKKLLWCSHSVFISHRNKEDEFLFIL